ncbi:helix-turn-helix domain-containing protein [Geomonas sp. Red32]|uniref:helix-turn-helix domain-containing protein n=1 Tax=Geomonas sp. Red32 TaxID=2912856 RepID=UPI00202CEE8A|nr:helix-turn-helix domain-containing protein [Geomonas sp. Red32]MCM0082177.1 helix-turn-helix domain-containing protein [Geomonas sp. Red32]
MAAEPKTKTKSCYGVKSIEESWSLLTLLFESRRGMTLTELIMASGISKNKTFRLLSTFEKQGILDKDLYGVYSLGSSASVAARKVLWRGNVGDAADPALKKVASILDESVYFAHRCASRTTLMYMADCNQKVRVRSLVGSVFFERANGETVPAGKGMEGVRITVGAVDREVTTVALDVAPVGDDGFSSLMVVAPSFRMSHQRIAEEIVPALREAVRELREEQSEPKRRRSQPAVVHLAPQRAAKRSLSEKATYSAGMP